jgi:hypothetical protein
MTQCFVDDGQALLQQRLWHVRLGGHRADRHLECRQDLAYLIVQFARNVSAFTFLCLAQIGGQADQL